MLFVRLTVLTLLLLSGAAVCGSVVCLICPGDWKVRQVNIDLRTLQNVARLYRTEMGPRPSSIGALVRAGYLTKVPRDPWGRPYELHWSRQDVFFVSLGEDLEDEGDDVTTGALLER